MIIFDEDKVFDSLFVERVWHCHSEGTGSFLSIAASNCELVVSRLQGEVTVTLRGPETRATPVGDCPGEGEWFGIILKLGAFLPQFPVHTLVNTEVNLPLVSLNSFWLAGSAWQLPNYDNADIFADRLVRAGLLVRDALVDVAIRGQLPDREARTVQRRFRNSTGLTQNMARQIERARYATYLLQHGVPILNTVEQAGYYDQPHLTRSLQHFVGQTPAQLREKSRREQMSFLYKTTLFA